MLKIVQGPKDLDNREKPPADMSMVAPDATVTCAAIFERSVHSSSVESNASVASAPSLIVAKGPPMKLTLAYRAGSK